MMKTTTDIQRQLAAAGFDPGTIDGIRGPDTIAAIRAFQTENGLDVDGIVGLETSSALFAPASDDERSVWGEIIALIARLLSGGDQAETPIATLPPWLKNAYLDLGEAEIKGPRHNARIVEFWQAIGQPIFDDETPYCAAGVGCWLEEAGLASTRSGLARSYGRAWGVKLSGPVVGAIATKGRTGSKTYGHVTIVAGRTVDGRLACLGANQGDKVQISPYAATAFSGADDCGFFWPKDYPLPKPGRFADLPVIDAYGNTVKES